MDTGNFFLFIGQLPTWLQGILLRNGPGMHTIGDSKYNHWFDGLALLHSFTFKNGKLLHIGLKGTQQPTFSTFWCLMLLILFRVGLECFGFCLQSAVCVRGELLWGKSLHTPPHTSPFTAAAGASLQGCLQGDVTLSFLPQCQSSVLLSPEDSRNPALGRSLQEQENLHCFERISHKYCHSQRFSCCGWTAQLQGWLPFPFWDLVAAVTAARRETGPLCHFTCQTSLSIFDTSTASPPACHPYGGKTGSSSILNNSILFFN